MSKQSGVEVPEKKRASTNWVTKFGGELKAAEAEHVESILKAYYAKDTAHLSDFEKGLHEAIKGKLA